MKTKIVIFIILIPLVGSSQSNSLHKLIVNHKLAEGEKNQFWNGIIFDTKDTTFSKELNLYSYSTTIDSIPAGDYHIQIKNIFGDVIDTNFSIKFRPTYRLTLDKLSNYYINESVRNVNFTNELKASISDSLYLICRFDFQHSAEFEKFQIIKKKSEYFIRHFEDLSNENYVEIKIDTVLFNEINSFETKAEERIHDQSGGFDLYVTSIFSKNGNVKIYCSPYSWIEGYEFIMKLKEEY